MKISSIPQLYRNVNRWGEFLSILSKYGLADGISRLDLDFAKNFFKDRGGEPLARQSPETRIRLALVDLGPTFIKLGQILSTRPDLIGVRLAEELSHLQTEVRADSPEQVRQTIERELCRPIEELFSEFEAMPMASASIGQAHRARLRSGEPVVVKVRHAGIEERIRVDLEILAGFAQLAERVPELAAYQPRATAAEFQRILLRELDFGREERHMRQFARNFADDPSVRIPRSYPRLCSDRVLTMELLEGMRLCDVARAEGNGFDLDTIARRGAHLYLEMIFAHGFYHADPHPGNLVVLPGNVIGLIDFGMVGHLEGAVRDTIEDMLLAVISQDSEHLTSLIARLGAVPADLDRASLTMDVSEFVAHYATRSLAEFNLSGALNDLTEIIRRHHIRLPAGAGMLIKTLVMLEGTSRLLSPQFNLMEVMRPYRSQMLWRRYSPGRHARIFEHLLWDLEHLAEILPRRLANISEQVETGSLDLTMSHRGLEPSVNRLVLGLLTSALFVGSSLLLAHRVPPLAGEVSLLGCAGAIVSLVMAFRLFRAINRSGRLHRPR